jgi:hypothetical protein
MNLLVKLELIYDTKEVQECQNTVQLESNRKLCINRTSMILKNHLTLHLNDTT